MVDLYSNLIDPNLTAIYGGAVIVSDTDEAKRSHQTSEKIIYCRRFISLRL